MPGITETVVKSAEEAPFTGGEKLIIFRDFSCLGLGHRTGFAWTHPVTRRIVSNDPKDWAPQPSLQIKPKRQTIKKPYKLDDLKPFGIRTDHTLA